jgi:D-alanyl-D-alanine carboxypeptidase (penicillin-binding protein 5/6)
MKYIKLCIFIVSFNLALVINSSALDISAKYAILLDYDSGEVLYSKNADVPTTPSSMTKLLTSYIVFELLDRGNIQLSDKFYISRRAWKMGGSRTFVEYGNYVRLETLLLGMIVQSGNDATVAIAEGVAGSEDEFAKLMTEKASELGLSHTKMLNSTGWPEDGHKMSTRDIALLSRELVRNFPEYSKYFALKDFTYNGIYQENRNKLLKRDIGVDGLKTGVTDIAGYGLAATAKRGNRRVITVVNGLSNERGRDQNTMQLINYGFNSFTDIAIADKGEVLAEIPLWCGKDKYVTVKAPEDLYFTVNNVRASKVEAILHYDSEIRAPVKPDSVVAELEIKGLSEDKTIAIKAGKEYKASMLNGFYSLFY